MLYTYIYKLFPNMISQCFLSQTHSCLVPLMIHFWCAYWCGVYIYVYTLSTLSFFEAAVEIFRSFPFCTLRTIFLPSHQPEAQRQSRPDPPVHPETNRIHPDEQRRTKPDHKSQAHEADGMHGGVSDLDPMHRKAFSGCL